MKNNIVRKCESCSKSVDTKNYHPNSKMCRKCHNKAINNCKTCQEYKREIYPNHFASSNCESGKRNHCTCDTCF